MELRLTPEEHQLLLRILEQHQQALLKEIWRTDCRDFRMALQADEKQLDSIVDRMRQALVLPPRG